MRLPDPAGLLCLHPGLPTPWVSGRQLETAPTLLPTAVPRGGTDRLRIAAQLLALTAELAQLDLWPGRSALRRAVVLSAAEGWQARVESFPIPLDGVLRRLGGGETAVAVLRQAALDAIRHAAGLPENLLPAPSIEPGPLLHAELLHVLDRLGSRLDRSTARSLWLLSLPEQRLPLEGEVVLRHVPDDEVADRLAAACWCSLERRRRQCWVWRVGAGDETGPLPARGGPTVLLVVGPVGPLELAAAQRWAARPGSAAIVLGRFPTGWSPPRPGALGEPWRLVLVGLARDRERLEIERWRPRIDPAEPATAEPLSEAVRARFRSRSAKQDEAVRSQHDRASAERLLGMLPEGIPEGFLVLHAGELLDRLRAGRVADTRLQDGRWRLLQPRQLEPHPLHLEVASLFPPGDPRRLRHLALARVNAGELEEWVQQRLDALEPAAVTEILSGLAPGALASDIDLGVAEACLWRHDLTGARAAMAAVDEPLRRPFELWIDALDAVSGGPIPVPDPGVAEEAPRAAAAVAAAALVRAVRRRDGSLAGRARACLASLDGRLAPAVHGWVELLEAAADRPARLGDRAWRRRVVGRHPLLNRELLHRAGLMAMAEGRSEHAVRLLERAQRTTGDPGLLGRLELDLGAAAAGSGRTAAAEVHLQRSFALLEAAGFTRLPSAALGNLAMTDVDSLRVDRAAARLEELIRRHDDPFSRAELARLELARGDLDAARRELERMPAPERAGGANLVEALHLVHGVLAVLSAGVSVAGRRHLQRGGDEGRVWLDLLDALEGGRPAPAGDDGWGVSVAARWISSGRATLASGVEFARDDPRLAMAAAIADRVARGRFWIDRGERRRFARRLESLGATGWARSLRNGLCGEPEWLAAVCRLAELGEVRDLAMDEELALLDGLGVTGLEVRAADGRRRVVRIGDGAPGAEVPAGRLRVVPLGGTLHDDPAWRLVRALLDREPALGPAPAPAPDPEEARTGLFGGAPAMVALRTEIARLAPMRLTVLLLGETGVGKEVAARAIHALSGRQGRFVAVNVAAIPEALLEAELFGSMRGAFTGADRDRKGLVEAAEGGTLFLDEIGDLGRPLQAKLLRFLESFEVRPVGSDRTRTVDVRVVAATHHDLEAGVQGGGFRSDLYYRIAAATISIAPLRARREDILELRDLFQRQLEEREGLPQMRWAREAESALLDHGWPGNVRELRHVVEVARVRARGTSICATDLGLPGAPSEEPPPRRWDEALSALRRRLIGDALARHAGNRSAAARELGISRQALLYHLAGMPAAGKKRAGPVARWRKEEV